MLDFDGVLHPAQGSAVPDFIHASRLDQLLAGYDCDVVISSTWREHYSFPKICAMLPDGLAARVIDTLGPDLRGPFVRYRNILAWLETRAVQPDWRALDDSESEFPECCPGLIVCDGQTGLSTVQEEELRKWLEG
jgi:hypothetical protein